MDDPELARLQIMRLGAHNSSLVTGLLLAGTVIGLVMGFAVEKLMSSALFNAGEGTTLAECCFAPKNKNAAEGEGYLMGVATRNLENGRSDLVILDAQRLEDGPSGASAREPEIVAQARGAFRPGHRGAAIAVVARSRSHRAPPGFARDRRPFDPGRCPADAVTRHEETGDLVVPFVADEQAVIAPARVADRLHVDFGGHGAAYLPCPLR